MDNIVSNEFKLSKDFYEPYRRCLNLVDTIIDDYIVDHEGYEVISYTNKRIKTEKSIKEKLDRHNLEYTIENVENRLKDIAGIRIVCPFLRDVEEVISYLKTNPYIEKIINEKDYINHPKESGYRSYHMIVMVKDTVLDGENVRYLPVEIQIRTLAMDCYAALEHRLRYKKDSDFVYDMNKKIEKALKTTIDIDYSLNDVLCDYNRIKDEDNNDDVKYNLYKYEYAMNKLRSIINRMKEELTTENYSPIEAIKLRLKTDKSINKKLRSRNKKSIDEIHDVVAARIICPFISDISTIIDKIIFNTEFEIIGFKDYVNKPKENGYTSFHILVRIPVYIDGVSDYVDAEIQIRTITMNMWASLHHKLCYERDDSSSEVAEMLKGWAKDLREIDADYDNIYRNYCMNTKNKVKQLVKNN
ncbi:MAG: hypothetical protein VZS44_08410 [Bacilli bacterium]|nr:hypothetical protein [Bacilli bacterium]